jgi:hypothetical protein
MNFHWLVSFSFSLSATAMFGLAPSMPGAQAQVSIAHCHFASILFVVPCSSACQGINYLRQEFSEVVLV